MSPTRRAAGRAAATRSIDFLAMVGDSSDNIPGVKGIGEKGAAEAARGVRRPRRRFSPRGRSGAEARAGGAAGQTPTTRGCRGSWSSIHLDVPVSSTCRISRSESRIRQAALTQLLTELEFFSLAKRLVGGWCRTGERRSVPIARVGARRRRRRARRRPPLPQPAHALAPSRRASRSWTIPAILPASVARLRAAPLVALDTETNARSPHEAELVGLSLAASPTEVWYLPFGHRPPGGELAAPAPVKNLPPLYRSRLRAAGRAAHDPGVPKAGHNIKFDWQVLRRAGSSSPGWRYDSMLASFVLDPGRRSHAIDTLCARALRPADAVATRTSPAGARPQIPFAEVPVPRRGAYCGDDSATVLALHDLLRAGAARHRRWSRCSATSRCRWSAVLTDMEWDGHRHRSRGLRAAERRSLAPTSLGWSARSRAWPGRRSTSIRPGSSPLILFDKQQLPVLKKTKSGPSTDADVLEQLAAMGHALPRLILEYRELQKLKSTYVDTLPATVNRHTGRIHTSFNQTGAATGRLSSSDPNLQNIPIRTPRGEAIRRGFVPRAGLAFLVADYSPDRAAPDGAPLGRPGLHRGVPPGRRHPPADRGAGLQLPVEQVTREMRARAKTINFATIYGQGPFALSRQLGISQEDAKTFIARYFERFAGRARLSRPP